MRAAHAIHTAVVFALVSSASADPTATFYAGAGRSTEPEASGVTGSVIGGGAVRFPINRGPWSTVVSLDARRIYAEEDVAVGDFTTVIDARGFGVRGLAGIRAQSRGSATVFAQLSMGIECDLATYDQHVRPFGGPGPGTLTHERVSSWGLALEPAFGASVHSGRTAFGVRLSVSWSGIEPLMPTWVNTQPKKVPDVFLTLFADVGL